MGYPGFEVEVNQKILKGLYSSCSELNSNFIFRASTNTHASEERNHNFILITMSALFIGCQWLKIVPDLYELFGCTMTGHYCKMDGPVNLI